MRIERIDDLHADAGWRTISFLKITADNGLVGWSEYNESYGSRGLSGVIRAIGAGLVGEDPRPVERHTARLYAETRQAPGGLNAQAIAAIENALLDLKAKALGVPVYELFGGPVRDRFRLYWSHCGTYLFDHAETIGVPALGSLDDVRALGARVAAGGFSALKCNIYRFDGGRPHVQMPGFGRVPGGPELNLDRATVRALRDQIAAFREGAGPEVDILLDLNFNFRTDGYMALARALDDLGLYWIEIDDYDAEGLAMVRRAVSTPIASCESLYGRRQFRPFLENYAMDAAIIDVPWNGFSESLKIAAMCDAWEINVAPHNFYGHLSTLMSAHMCAVAPNFRIMEIDIDDVPWKDDLVTEPPRIENGELLLPAGPGWGAEVNEEAVRAHPPRRP